MLFERQPQHKSVFLRITVVRRPLANRTEPRAEIERLGRMVRLSHFKVNLLHSAISERSQPGAEERPGNPAPTKIRRHSQVENLSSSRYFAPDEIAGNALFAMGD